MKLQVFNGGLNTRQAPYLLQTNEAVEYSNVDNESSSLKPVKKKATSGTLLDQWAYYFEAQEVWESSATKRHYLEYQANLYYTIVNGVPKYFDGTTHYLLGIEAPSVALIVSDGIAGNLTGTYNYIVTYYNSTKGVESQPSPISLDVVAVAESIDVTSIPVSSDPQVDEKRIYRVGGNLTSFSLVATIPNATVSYNDDIADVDIPGNDMIADDYDQCQSGMKYLTEAYGILFGVLDDKLYFSLTGQFTYWPAVNFIDFPVEITGIAATSLGLVVFTSYRTYIITGATPAAFSKRTLSGDQGCLTFDSIQYVKNTVLWVSSDGICSIDGSVVKVLSKDKLGTTALSIAGSAFHNEVYYALKSDNTIIAYDFRFGAMLKELDLEVTNLVVAEDTLYGYKTDSYFELFADTADESFAYTSPELSDGSLTLRKTYKSVLIHCLGAIQVQVYIDGTLRKTKSFTTHDTHEVKVPEEYKNGYHIQFRFTGTGEVFEVDYTVGAFKK